MGCGSRKNVTQKTQNSLEALQREKEKQVEISSRTEQQFYLQVTHRGARVKENKMW